MIKKLFGILSLSLLLILTGCSEGVATSNLNEDEHRSDPDQTWAIYWYLCGSDLESENGFATTDLEEMLEVELPENVKIIIQTGGAYGWQNDVVDESCLQRYVYDSEGLYIVDEQPLANMGSADTLADFLSFCKSNYPADRTVALFWNHGGGSVAGAAFDEIYDYDSLTLDEFHKAFDKVYSLSYDNQPFDLIGFDTCLMSSIDTAYTFSDIAEYMVASEEWEPGYGWAYTGWLQNLSDDPGIDGALLGKMICDSYLEDCELSLAADEATLSVVDLNQLQPLMKAYEKMGEQALLQAIENPEFLSFMAREAEQSENYGGNTREQGYTNLMDLGHFAKNCEEILPDASKQVLETLDDCVLYRINGSYRENATGLSCYYAYDGDMQSLSGYKEQGCSQAFKYLYEYQCSGTLGQDGINYISTLGYEEEIEPVEDLIDMNKTYPLYIDDEDYVTLEIDPAQLDLLKSVHFQLAYIDEEEDIMLLLGEDNDIVTDWETGKFSENFRGVWGAIDENLVYMEVVYEDENYTMFAIPILLNGEDYNLHVVYDFEQEEYIILGARKGLYESGAADKNMVKLEEGDEITTVHYMSTLYGDDDFEPYYIDSFTVTEDTHFSEVDLGDGTFIMMFKLNDFKNNEAYSEMVQFTVNGDNWDIEILE